MELIKTLNPENLPENKIATFSIRNAARAIVYDQDGNVGILHVSKKNYHKLPGGGVEEGESVQEALTRECLEELGCVIEVCGEVGRIVEYRGRFSLQQISDCYLARTLEAKDKPSFTKEELDDGFKVLWLPMEKAIEVLTSDKPGAYESGFIVIRDSTFLEVAQGMT